jgi:hypothetical protein
LQISFNGKKFRENLVLKLVNISHAAMGIKTQISVNVQQVDAVKKYRRRILDQTAVNMMQLLVNTVRYSCFYDHVAAAVNMLQLL